ncbi:Metal tolerance protein 1 [Acorus calamus]|uniref:Metal tolerance protein 1 n=1 Tax=Acorus calamus TaxID=4465 RepID=A0AAV9F7Y1_ACOCL|nr:Metal tolerance protein 1 [Acorus calamus]
MELEISTGTPSEVPAKPRLACARACAFAMEGARGADHRERSQSARKLWGALVLCILFMVVETVGGIASNSLAILTDAAHLMTDVLCFAVSLFAIRASGWDATPNSSYGYSRIEVLGALASIQLIWLVVVCLIYESVCRFFRDGGVVNGKLMFVTSAFGFVVNFVMAIWLGHGHNHDHAHSHECGENASLVSGSGEGVKVQKNLNLVAANLHVWADLFQSFGVMIGGAVIWIRPDWLIVDLICTFGFSVLVLCTTRRMLVRVVDVLMENAPDEIDVIALERGLKSLEGVCDVHDLHVWAISVGRVALACHVMAAPDATDAGDIHLRIRDYLEEKYGISHVTVQVELD